MLKAVMNTSPVQKIEIICPVMGQLDGLLASPKSTNYVIHLDSYNIFKPVP